MVCIERSETLLSVYCNRSSAHWPALFARLRALFAIRNNFPRTIVNRCDKIVSPTNEQELRAVEANAPHDAVSCVYISAFVWRHALSYKRLNYAAYSCWNLSILPCIPSLQYHPASVSLAMHFNNLCSILSYFIATECIYCIVHVYSGLYILNWTFLDLINNIWWSYVICIV